MQETYISVGQVSNYIKQILDSEYMLKNICVYGEVSSYNISNGIAYFNIKDQDNLLQCVLFGALKFDSPKVGDMVLVTGSVSYYAKGGRLSFNATKIMPYGKGQLYEKFLELKNKLESLGYFALDRKKTIPKRVKNIGIVTSETGAVIQDIIDVSNRRNNSVNLILYPVKVQGVGAEFEIAKGIEFFSNYEKIDCIIVARGGGSLEDLQPFNTEIVANAVYRCKKPLVSAVGHETDFTIIDFVSDLRAPTPSAAAELVVNAKVDDFNEIVNSIYKIERSLSLIYKKVEHQIEKDLGQIYNALLLKHNKNESLINNSLNKLNIFIDNKLIKLENETKLLENNLQKLNPNNLLQKGYTKIQNNKGVVFSVNDLNKGDEISIYLKDGNLSSIVNNITKRG